MSTLYIIDSKNSTCLSSFCTSGHVDVRERTLDARLALLLARRKDGTLRRSMLAYCCEGAVPWVCGHWRGDEDPNGVLNIRLALRSP